MFDTLAAGGIWTDTVGLAFTFFVLMPALATALVIVAIVSGRGEKRDNEELRGRWGRKAKSPDDA